MGGRTSITVSKELAEKIAELATRLQRTRPQVIREAVELLELWLDTEEAIRRLTEAADSPYIRSLLSEDLVEAMYRVQDIVYRHCYLPFIKDFVLTWDFSKLIAYAWMAKGKRPEELTVRDIVRAVVLLAWAVYRL